MSADELPAQPSLLWRSGSAVTVGVVGFLCRTFLMGMNQVEVNGWDRFQKIVDERRDVQGRERGLVTGRRTSTV